MTDQADTERKLRQERDRYKELWIRTSEECNRLVEERKVLDELRETARDLMHAAWSTAASWPEYCEERKAELEEERKDRDALIRLEVDRLTGRTPKRRGRPPLWQPESEDEIERMHRGGASVRQIAADLHMSKTQVHRVITRVRRHQAEAAELGRLKAVAAGQSPTQRQARGAQRAAEQRPIEDYDLVRAERGLEFLDSLPDDGDETDA
jgi:hypothetical protein